MASSWCETARRHQTAIAVSLAGPLAGCSSGEGDTGGNDTEGPSDRDGDGIPDEEDSYPEDPDRSERLDSAEETLTVHEDESEEYVIRVDDAPATLDLK